MKIQDAEARCIEVEPGSTVVLMRTNPRLARLTSPIKHGYPDVTEIPAGTVIRVQVVVTQTRRADGTLCAPSFSFEVNGRHQWGGFVRHLGDDGWPTNDTWLEYDETGDGFEVPRYVVPCPGCAMPIEVSARPTPKTWLDAEQWCPLCRGALS